MRRKFMKLLTCVGTVGAMTVAMAVPALADTTDKETFDWSDKAAANVTTYANIRKGSDISTERVGKLPAGAVVTVVGEENGWVQVSSGEIEGYIREDLLVSGEEAQQLFESVYGDGEITGAQPLDAVVETAAVSNQTTSVSQADLD